MTNCPRPIPVYIASEVVAFINEVYMIDVSPYLRKLWEMATVYKEPTNVILHINPEERNYKMRELKEAIYNRFGTSVYVLYDLDPGSQTLWE